MTTPARLEKLKGNVWVVHGDPSDAEIHDLADQFARRAFGLPHSLPGTTPALDLAHDFLTRAIIALSDFGAALPSSALAIPPGGNTEMTPRGPSKFSAAAPRVSQPVHLITPGPSAAADEFSPPMRAGGEQRRKRGVCPHGRASTLPHDAGRRRPAPFSAARGAQ